MKLAEAPPCSRLTSRRAECNTASSRRSGSTMWSSAKLLNTLQSARANGFHRELQSLRSRNLTEGLPALLRQDHYWLPMLAVCYSEKMTQDCFPRLLHKSCSSRRSANTCLGGVPRSMLGPTSDDDYLIFLSWCSWFLFSVFGSICGALCDVFDMEHRAVLLVLSA